MLCYCCRRRVSSAVCDCGMLFCIRCGVCDAHCVCLIGEWVGEGSDTVPLTPEKGEKGECTHAAGHRRCGRTD